MTAGVPPTLPGLTFIEKIGTGGFADVYLYQQALPARRVAVKVLRESTDEVGRAQFHAEANVMAQLSGHPSIVPIYQADVSADGRAYLVMEFCPPPHLAQRYRSERIPVPDVLEIGVKISSAVETAHRVGILHRDIKPHNILTSAYGAPLLTDFGIASVAGDASDAAYGMSVPWSPPEAFEEDAPFDVRSDVFALAATVYSLLAGRSPFEIPGAANDSATLIHRIENQAPSRILRADVPDSLNDLLARAMAKRLEDRPSSAMAFARALQEIQIELHLAPTRLEVMDASPEGSAPGAEQVSDERTRVRPVSIIVPEEIAERGTRLRPRQVTQLDDRTSVRPRREPAPETVVRRRTETVGDAVLPTVGPATVEPAEERSGGKLGLIVGGVAAVVVLGVVGAAVAFGGDPKEPAKTEPSAPKTDVVLASTPVEPDDLQIVRNGTSAVVTWNNPAREPGDTFTVSAGPSLERLVEAYRGEENRAVVTKVAKGSMLCVNIRTVRSGSLSDPLESCQVLK